MADFVVDMFTAADDTQIDGRTGETGATWTKRVGMAATSCTSRETRWPEVQAAKSSTPHPEPLHQPTMPSTPTSHFSRTSAIA